MPPGGLRTGRSGPPRNDLKAAWPSFKGGLASAFLKEFDRALDSRAPIGSSKSSPAQGSDPARFSFSHQPVNIVSGNKAGSAYRHHFGLASSTTDLYPPDLAPVEEHAVSATPPTKSSNSASRLYSYVCSHGLLQSHLGFLRPSYSVFASCAKIERKYTKKGGPCQQLFFEKQETIALVPGRGTAIESRIRERSFVICCWNQSLRRLRVIQSAAYGCPENSLDIVSRMFENIRQIFRFTEGRFSTPAGN